MNSVVREVSDVSISDRAVTLTLASAVAPTDQVTLSYQVMLSCTVGTHPIRDKAGNIVAALIDQAVTTSAPYVSSLEISSMPAARQTYSGGEEIELRVTFSESVTVTGTPQLFLSFNGRGGSYGRAAQYVTGSGTAVLEFRYSVAEGIDRLTAGILRFLRRGNVKAVGDEDPDGLSIAADALHTHDGTIRDGENHDAALILDELTDTEAHKVDGIWPQLVSDDPLVVNGATLTLRYDEMLDENSEPAFDAFAVTAGGAPGEVTGVSIDDSTVTLTLLTPVGASDEVRLSYTAPDGTDATPVRDLVGNNVQDFTGSLVRNATPPPPPPPGPGGGRGGGPACAEDVHGNSAAQATDIALDTMTSGAICPAADRDYFTVTAPGRGLVFVDTTGSVQTRDTISQNETVLATGPTGSRQDARLGASVQAGTVVVAVQGQGGATGDYELVVTFVPGYLENPGPDSFQSGIGVLSGWVCEAETVELVIDDTEHHVAAYGTDRADTEEMCGDTGNGFGLLFNWNRLRDGEHTVIAYVDNVELGRATVRVTTLGHEFLRGAEGECVVEDFPRLGQSVLLEWQQTSQNFIITAVE